MGQLADSVAECSFECIGNVTTMRQALECKLNIDDLITHRLPLERTNEGFDLMKSGESIRSVVLY